jgi:RNA polymerase sigma-70 factor (ECF subfamily)
VPANDLELLERWRGGEKQAGSELFERHFPAVYRFISNKVSDGAEDLVQQAFLACVEGRDRFRQEASFRTYLFAAARNILYSHWRKQGSAPGLDFAITSLEDLGPSPSSALSDEQDERILLEGLRRIPLDFQIALELYYFEGLKSREIAEILEIPSATVRSRLRRALGHLRTQLEDLENAGRTLESTLTRIDDWAADLQEQVD